MENENAEEQTQEQEQVSAEPQLASAKGAHVGERFRGLEVKVTVAEIEQAMPKDSGHCMISDAVHASAKERKWRIGKVLTDLQTIRFTDLKRKVRYICFTPRVGQLALLQFDQGQKPEPFAFRLSPVQVIPMGGAPRRLAVKTKAGGGSKRPIIHGGKALPTMREAGVAIGLRREFGLRSMGVFRPVGEAAAEELAK